MMQSNTFIRTITCGFIATFMMMMIAFMQGGLGLPVIDVGHFLKESFNLVHEPAVYSILWGNIAYYIMGMMLALIWVVFLQNRIPGNWFIQGLIYGVIISLVAGLVVSPLVSSAAGESFGLFYMDTWVPGLILLAGLTMHLGYGVILTLSLKYAGVQGLES
jgi:hypothetical protein